MKFLLVSIILILITGCINKNEKEILKTITNKLNKIDSYKLEGNLEIYNNDSVYNYDVNVLYKKENNFKVELVNKNNNHKQVILRNKEGVYVITPSLNKSFKFESTWPYNNSQIYLLQTLINDINNDKNYKAENNKKYIIYKSKVNYLNNDEIKYQKVYIKNDKINKVELYNNDDSMKMKMEISKIEYNKKINENKFKLNNVLDDNKETTKSTMSIDDIVYPMYLPQNTKLSSSKNYDTENGERVILTFDGDKPFTFIEENINSKTTDSIVEGDPILINDNVMVVGDDIVAWNDFNLEYKIASTDLNSKTLINIANSVNSNSYIK